MPYAEPTLLSRIDVTETGPDHRDTHHGIDKVLDKMPCFQ